MGVQVTVLGGGGFRTPLLVRALRASRLTLDRVTLYDVDPDRLAVMAAVLGEVEVSTDPAAAMAGADIVFSAMRIGGADGRVADERAALAAGVLGQETTGAGGLAYALRCLPMCLDLARHVPPAAWFVNMTNPAGIVTEALRPALGDRVVGVCDSPSRLIRRAERALDLVPGTATPDYLGLNHLGWLRSLDVEGVDRLPSLLRDPARLERTEEGRLFGATFLAALRSLPNEYLWYWYLAREAAAASAAGETRGEHVARTQAAFYAEAAAHPEHAAHLWAAANGERNASYLAEARAEGEERDTDDADAGGYETVAVALAEALTGGAPTRLVLNTVVEVEGLPTGSVVETLCDVTSEGVVPVPSPPPSPHQLGLMATVKACERAVIEAVVTRSPEAAFRAFALHPLVGAAAAESLADDAWARSGLG